MHVLQFYYSLYGNKIHLLDEDAYVVGLSFFPPAIAPNLCVSIVQAMAEATGVKLSKRQSLKALLTSFGHELYKSGKVELKKEAGLTRTDIVHL